MNTYTNGQNKIEKEGSNLGKVPSFSRPPPILDHGGLGEKESLVSWEKIFEFQNQSSIKYTNLYKYMRHMTTKESTIEQGYEHALVPSNNGHVCMCTAMMTHHKNSMVYSNMGPLTKH